MDLIDMAGEVFFVADTMFSISPLPNCLFPLALPAANTTGRRAGGMLAVNARLMLRHRIA